MTKKLDIRFDDAEIDAIAADFDLRKPNKSALRKLILTLTEDDFDRHVVQVMNMATGVGKTYLMAAFVEYLRRQGIRNVMIVTPSLTVQTKTVQNFSAGSKRYIKGAAFPPQVVTPQDYSAWRAQLNAPNADLFGSSAPTMVFIFNIQQLLAPKDPDAATKGNTAKAAATRIRRFEESSGGLFEYLQNLDDLVVIADESHLYSSSAKAFKSALKELDPAATIGLTASKLPEDHVIFTYPLYKAIEDKYVKTPVLAFRAEGYKDGEASEEQQLRDAVALLKIKQDAYDAFTAATGKEHLNAVLFVVCSDVAHATSIAELLRTAEFFNSANAVLQVDNAHNDPHTLDLLDRLDDPKSPIRAVVSVNKLKEGWDVKNIAVVVTLRAMASEVLTQQTMGRGLRLPFGSYTGQFHIDQLDIISHQSFKELLTNENVLNQFGLEEAVKNADSSSITQQVERLVNEAEENSGGTQSESFTDSELNANSNSVPRESWHSDPARNDSSAQSTAQSAFTVNVTTVGERTREEQEGLRETRPEVVPRNSRFADVKVLFPRTKMDASAPEFALHKIPSHAVVEAAHRVADSRDVIVRKEIRASVAKKLRAASSTNAEIDSAPLDEQFVKSELLKLLLAQQMVPRTVGNVRSAETTLIPEFMRNVNLDHWTAKSLASAERELRELTRAQYTSLVRNTVVEAQIVPVLVPNRDEIVLPVGEEPLEQIDSGEEFKKGAYYKGWFKSLFETDSFDSYTGEYQLASLLNTSPDIEWWLRLHGYMNASIMYTLKDTYYPDFIARDSEGTYWIIEGKSARGRSDAVVQAKRKAAEEAVRLLATMDQYAGQRWGYLIAYEDDIASADSWNDLCAMSRPVTTF